MHALGWARGAPSSPASGRLVPSPTLASVRRPRPVRRATYDSPSPACGARAARGRGRNAGRRKNGGPLHNALFAFCWPVAVKPREPHLLPSGWRLPRQPRQTLEQTHSLNGDRPGPAMPRSLAWPPGPRSPEAPSPRRGRHFGRASRPRSSRQEMAIGTQESPLWVLCLFLFHRPSRTRGGRVNVNVSDTSEKGLTLLSSSPLSPHGGEGWQPCFPTKWRHVSPARNWGGYENSRMCEFSVLPQCLQDEMEGRL